MSYKPTTNMAALIAAARKRQEETGEKISLPVLSKGAGAYRHQSTNPPIKVTLPSNINGRIPKPALSAIDLLRAKLAAKKIPSVVLNKDTNKEILVATTGTTTGTTTGMSGETITYNSQQQSFITHASNNQSCVLIGAAGTGKTTCSKGGISALIANGSTRPLDSADHKHLRAGGPGIIITSFTRRAVNNIRKVQSEDMKHNCITVHKLLEYQPEYFEIFDPETGLDKKTMRFVPARNSSNPLPASIQTIIVEEASMLSIDLFTELLEALTHSVQWIFIGDIQQLPPVFGAAILGFKMLELPVIELTQVYRQALESPIIRLAHRVLSGKPIPAEEYESWHTEGQLTIHPWKKKLSADNAALTLAAFFKKGIDTSQYDPDHDMILIPYNKACGTIEVNAQIANHLARKRQALTYEIMAGFNKHYFSVGDKVLYDREDAEIIEISKNPAYAGAYIQPESKHLDYWGHNPKFAEEQTERNMTGIATIDNMQASMDVDLMLEQIAGSDDRVTQASHKLVVRLVDTMAEVTITKAADVNGLLHAYALTVHKSQGSEWRKVFVCFHQSHATMLQRELLYTAVTRAREELYVICEPESFTKGIVSQRIKGDSLKEKAEYFKGKITDESVAKYKAIMLDNSGE